MKKTFSGKLNMALSMRIALGLALVIALTGCSGAANATSGKSDTSTSTASSAATSAPSSASTVETSTPADTTASDASELAEANQPTPSSSVASGSKDAADYWVSSDEFDMYAYLSNFGEPALSTESILLCTLDTGWVAYLSDSSKSGESSIIVRSLRQSDSSSTYNGYTSSDQYQKSSEFVKIPIYGRELLVDLATFNIFLDVISRCSNSSFDGKYCPFTKNGQELCPHTDGLVGCHQ